MSVLRALHATPSPICCSKGDYSKAVNGVTITSDNLLLYSINDIFLESVNILVNNDASIISQNSDIALDTKAITNYESQHKNTPTVQSPLL